MKSNPLNDLQRYPLVHVRWRDAAHVGGEGWMDDTTIVVPLLAAEAVGFKVHDGKNKYGEDCVGLASAIILSIEGKPEFCLSFIIPKGMIVSMKEINMKDIK